MKEWARKPGDFFLSNQNKFNCHTPSTSNNGLITKINSHFDILISPSNYSSCLTFSLGCLSLSRSIQLLRSADCALLRSKAGWFTFRRRRPGHHHWGSNSRQIKIYIKSAGYCAQQQRNLFNNLKQSASTSVLCASIQAMSLRCYRTKKGGEKWQINRIFDFIFRLCPSTPTRSWAAPPAPFLLPHALEALYFFQWFFFVCIAFCQSSLSSFFFFSLSRWTYIANSITWNFNWGKKFHPELRARELAYTTRSEKKTHKSLPIPARAQSAEPEEEKKMLSSSNDKSQRASERAEERRNISTMWTFANDVFSDLWKWNGKRQRRGRLFNSSSLSAWLYVSC